MRILAVVVLALLAGCAVLPAEVLDSFMPIGWALNRWRFHTGVPFGVILSWFLASYLLGCLLSAATLSLLVARRSRKVAMPVTVRGPVTYAGPGSLGGTKSALRR